MNLIRYDERSGHLSMAQSGTILLVQAFNRAVKNPQNALNDLKTKIMNYKELQNVI